MSKLHFKINPDGSTSKTQQIVNSVTEAIDRKAIRRGQMLPSIRNVCSVLSLSRETVCKAYGELKSRGIVESVPGKGYFVSTESIHHQSNIMLLLSAFRDDQKVLYNSFIQSLPEHAKADIFFHHYNIDVFESLILDHFGKYNFYIIKPFNHPQIPNILKRIEPDKILILDRHDLLENRYASICQDFEDGMYRCLEEGTVLIRKYDALNLIYPENCMHPQECVRGFTRFCRDKAIEYKVISRVQPEHIQAGQAYLTIFDDDLVSILDTARQRQYRLGRDIGVISYNDTPLKPFIADGITVISTDFRQMGKVAATFVGSKERLTSIVPTSLIIRKSL